MENKRLSVKLSGEKAKPMKATTLQIKRKRLTDQIIDKLISMIASGSLQLGSKLPAEHELMEQFGVGRSSIREAIGALSLIGLLTVSPGRGTHVAVSSDKTLAKSTKWAMLTIGGDKIHELIEAQETA